MKSSVAARSKADETHGFSDADVAEVMDSPEWTRADFERARSFADVFPEAAAKLATRRSRGAQKQPTKLQVSLRIERDVLDHFKAGGPGWQVRIGDALRDAAGLGRRGNDAGLGRRGNDAAADKVAADAVDQRE